MALFSSSALEQGHRWPSVLSLRQLQAGREGEGKVLQSNFPMATLQQLPQRTNPSFAGSTGMPGLLQGKSFTPAILKEQTRAVGGNRGEAAFCSVVWALFLSPGMCFKNKNQFRVRQDASPPTSPSHSPSITQTRSSSTRQNEGINYISVSEEEAEPIMQMFLQLGVLLMI